MGNEIDLFLEQSKADAGNRPLLEAFLQHLKDAGQFVAKGELQQQFIETIVREDKNKKKVEVSTCQICGHIELEVLDEKA